MVAIPASFNSVLLIIARDHARLFLYIMTIFSQKSFVLSVNFSCGTCQSLDPRPLILKRLFFWHNSGRNPICKGYCCVEIDSFERSSSRNNMKPRHISSKSSSKRRKDGFETKPGQSTYAESTKLDRVSAIQLFEPVRGMVYSIERASQLANVSRRRILIYCKRRLVSPIANPEIEGYWFDGETLRALKQIEELRTICNEPLAGVKLILNLTQEVQRLRNEMHALEI